MDWAKLFTPDAIAVYVTFLGTAIVTSLGWIVANRLSKKKPNIIRISREEVNSVLEVPARLRTNVKVFYADKEIPAIFQTQLIVVNLGEEALEDIRFCLQFTTGNIIDVLIEDPQRNSREAKFEFTPSEVRLTFPYINPYPSLKDKVEIIVLSNGGIKDLLCLGGGKSWKTEFVDFWSLRLSYAKIVSKADPRNPEWMYQYVVASIKLISKLFRI